MMSVSIDTPNIGRQMLNGFMHVNTIKSLGDIFLTSDVRLNTVYFAEFGIPRKSPP